MLLVAHASRNDEAYLKKVGFDLSELKIMDTQQIEHKEFAASRYESVTPSATRRRISTMLVVMRTTQ